MGGSKTPPATTAPNAAMNTPCGVQTWVAQIQLVGCLLLHEFPGPCAPTGLCPHGYFIKDVFK